MTLGGLALAVASWSTTPPSRSRTFTEPEAAKAAGAGDLDGAQQIAVPAFVSTLSICIVFVPVPSSRGRPARSSCRWPCGGVRHADLVPALSNAGADNGAALLGREVALYTGAEGAKKDTFFRPMSASTTTSRPCEPTTGAARLGAAPPELGLASSPLSWRCRWLGTQLGSDFFPSRRRLIKLHVRAPAGTRIEETEQLSACGGGRARDHRPGELGTSSTTSGAELGHHSPG